MKINYEIRNAIVSSSKNILGEDVLDCKLRKEKLNSLNESYKKELVEYYHFISTLERYEAYIEALEADDEYELFSYELWK